MAKGGKEMEVSQTVGDRVKDYSSIEDNYVVSKFKRQSLTQQFRVLNLVNKSQ